MSGLLMLENMNSDQSAKLCCCMICFVFIFIILVIAICWTNYDSFENFGNLLKYNQETMTNVLTGGIHYLSLNPNDNIIEKFNELKKKNKTALIAVIAPWCGYCKKLKNSGVLKKIAKKYPVLVIDDKHPQTEDLMHLLQAEGFPALGIFGHGKLFPYRGQRSYESIIPIMNQFHKTSMKPGARKHFTRRENFTNDKEGKIINVPSEAKPSELNWLINKHKKEGYKRICLIFTADWCGYCKALKKERLMESLAQKGTIVFSIDEGPLAKHYGVKGFPTIMCSSSPKEKHYEGPREVDSIIMFMDSNSNSR